MKKIIYFVFALILACIMINARDITTIEMKINALDDVVLGVIGENQTPLYDNFIASDGNEYVIVTNRDQFMFLIKLDKNDSNYSAEFILNNKTIEDIITKRNLAQGYVGIEDNSTEKLEELMTKLKEDRFAQEVRYDTLLGLDNKTCKKWEECKDICMESKFCKFAYTKEGNRVIDDMMEYLHSKDKMDLMMNEVDEIIRSEKNKNDLDSMKKLLENLNEIEKTMNEMYSNNIQNPDNILYSGKIEYNTEYLENAKNITSADIDVISAIRQKDESIEQIERRTAQYIPLIIPKTDEKKEENYTIAKNNQTINDELDEETNVSTLNDEKTAVVIEKMKIKKEKDENNNDIVTYLFAGFIILIIILIAIRFLKPKNKIKKKVRLNYSLEDLI